MACSSLAGFQSGSNITKRLAPIKFRPHPPALLLSMKMNSGFWETQNWGQKEKEELDRDDSPQKHLLTDGLLNFSTIFALFLMDMVPSSRTYRYLGEDKDNSYNMMMWWCDRLWTIINNNMWDVMMHRESVKIDTNLWQFVLVKKKKWVKHQGVKNRLHYLKKPLVIPWHALVQQVAVCS